MIPGHGHSPEHASLHAREDGLLVSGDMLLPRIGTNVSVWSTEPRGDPLGRYLASLHRFDACPADTLVLPSHGRPFRGLHRRIEAAARAPRRAARGIVGARPGRVPRHAAEVVPILFGREFDAHQMMFALGESLAHLNHLVHHERARRLVAPDGTIRFAP